MSTLEPQPAAPVEPEPRRIRVVIVENHRLVSESLGLLLDGQTDMEVVGSASSVFGAATLLIAVPPDVVVMDFHLDDGTGRDAAEAIRKTYPDARFVFLSRDDSDAARLAAVEAGASAFLHKSALAAEVIHTIREVAHGTSFITPEMVAELVATGRDRNHKRESLSPREREVLQMLADGVSTRQIAQNLGISYSTVRTHVRAINAKLETRSMISAVVTARALDLINTVHQGEAEAAEVGGP